MPLDLSTEWQTMDCAPVGRWVLVWCPDSRTCHKAMKMYEGATRLRRLFNKRTWGWWVEGTDRIIHPLLWTHMPPFPTDDDLKRGDKTIWPEK